MEIIEGDRPLERFWAAHRRQDLIALRTSGTTGNAKTIVRTTTSWTDSFDLVARRLDIGRNDHFWIPGSLNATMNLFCAALAEWRHIPWTTDPASATITTMTPSGLTSFLSDEKKRSLTRPDMTILIAGDGLNRRLRDEAISEGYRIEHYYGASELSLVAWGTCNKDLKIFDRVEIDIDSDNIIWVSSPWLSYGYLDNDLSCFVSRPDGFVTVKDRGNLDQDIVTIWGRDGAITTSGATVDLAPIKAQLSAQIAGDIELVALPHPRLGSVLTAVFRDEDDRITARSWARSHLDGPHRPRLWVRCEIPTTDLGKVDRQALIDTIQTGRMS